MTEERFSRPGDPPTEFEVRLLQAAAGDNDWLVVARDLMDSLGPVAGAAALLVVLDALSSEKIHVTTRAMLFRGLYLPHRNAEILRLLESKPVAEVAALVGLSPRSIRHIRTLSRKRSGRRSRCNPVSSRA